MKWLLFVGVLAACGGKQEAAKPAPPLSNVAPTSSTVEAPPPPPASTGQVRYPACHENHDASVTCSTATFEAFADAMCTCSTSACAQTVSDEMTRWATDMAKQTDTNHKVTDEETKRFTDISMRLGECMTKAMTPPEAGSASTP